MPPVPVMRALVTGVSAVSAATMVSALVTGVSAVPAATMVSALVPRVVLAAAVTTVRVLMPGPPPGPLMPAVRALVPGEMPATFVPAVAPLVPGGIPATAGGPRTFALRSGALLAAAACAVAAFGPAIGTAAPIAFRARRVAAAVVAAPLGAGRGRSDRPEPPDGHDARQDHPSP
jgi:hypothetical protein